MGELASVGEDATDFAFLGDGGEVGALIRSFDWSTTPLGPVETWPASLKTSTALLLQSPIPMVMLWGEHGIMIYNDAYSVFAGKRHPRLLGSKVREGWVEVADFNDNVMKVGLAGGTLAYRDQELTLYRRGVPEQVWMNLDYSPVLDEAGKPAGVIAIVVETTEKVLADRRNAAEHERLHQLFVQAPTFMAMLRGAEHRFELVNPVYHRLIGDRDVIGKTVEEALPVVGRQGFIEMLDKVYRSGEALSGTSQQVFLQRSADGPVEVRYVDFVYQPIRNDRGAVTHIFIQGSDVTERVLAENRQRLLVNELNHRVKNTLASVQAITTQTLRGAASTSQASEAITGRILALSRAHNVLTQENWDGAALHDVVRSTLEAFDGRDKARFDVSGTPIRLGPRAALTMSMALHELATNAAKYGGLSNEDGRIEINWSVKPGVDGDMFGLTWQEANGPEIGPAEHKGFGAHLLQRALPMELGGEVRIDYHAGGLSFDFRAPLAAMTEAGSLV